ncbi:DUF1841 family protein [Francisella orientalis]|uniref:DUF1841 family protein n=1 Tax=Francisella orientalis TaxID=299583 RepID=A0AAP7KIS2_9GAMM|nr:DUF1841 family protein [Francisella orientalis]AFJ43752.1 hypothetical protein OOM_1344 [Francisella orientalis str. Toba 04]AHB98303.1 hypothetical protein M973_04405 [Francisella orientalis LADL 07-285A]AKN85453.1 hypothetical protein FNO12_0761 [Francisella orientalis FNO12]AKN86992.1 Hypothetical protein FNO24_0761 [Francisella orientalis FNO24]AKN88530.1 Hypothetical protein FNO190_0761 [Francisella orientalis]
MIFSHDRYQLRKLFIDSWNKFLNKQSLTAIEEQISRIIELHPEYHKQITIENIDKDYSPEMGQINPFLHISLHLAIIEQVQTNRPIGINTMYPQLLSKYNNDEHKVHHLMIDYLAEEMWLSQKYNTLPDEQNYLTKLQELVLR